jgi:hypothetical protein
MIGHVSKYRPWHYLEKIPIERKGQAVGRPSAPRTATRVSVIEIRAVPDDL